MKISFRHIFSLILVALACGLAGCHLWENYESEISAACPPGDAEPRVLDVEQGFAETTGRVCQGASTRYALDLQAGQRLEVALSEFDAEATVSVELHTTDSSQPVQWPVWSPNRVGLEDLITRSGTYLLVVDSEVETSFRMEVTTESIPGQVRWIAADAPAGGDGSLDAPFADWPTALAALDAGDMLVARPGSWTSLDACDGLAEPCRAGAAMPDADCAALGIDGRDGAPIIVAAELERRAHLRDDGESSTLGIDGCQHWLVDGLTLESSDQRDVIGGDAVRVNESQDIELRRLLLRHSNRFNNSALVALDESRRVLVEESEFYAFHQRGVQVNASEDCEFRRLYMNSRGEPDIAPGSSWVTDSDRGDAGVSLYKAEAIHVADTVVEDAYMGFRVGAPGSSADGISVGDDHRFDGCVARDTTFGFALTAQSSFCSTPDDPDCVTEGNRLRNCVAFETEYGFRLAGGVDNAVSYSSAVATGIEQNNALGYSLRKANGDRADQAPAGPLRVERSMSFGHHDARGFVVDSDVDASLEYLNSADHQQPYDVDTVPGTATSVDPQLGSCVVYIPQDSPLSDVAGAPVGANVVYRHEGGQQTDRKLWDQRHGRFACGAVVPGFNDQAGSSCFDVNQRLAVGVGTCAVP